MNREEMIKYLEPEMARVTGMMEASLASDIGLLNMTNKSIMSHGGKRLRPLLALLAAKVCSGGHVTEDTIRFAAAVELLHNATLLHDDVADNSTSRRGVPTTMSLLGGRAAVLLGDFWLVKAMERVLQSESGDNNVIRIFAKTLSNLAEGEMLQLQKASGADTTEADYYRIIFNKTASLFETAALAGAISVGAEDERKKAAKEFAYNLGMAFQIKDDIFDYEADESIGKPVGQDLHEQKITLPLLGALNNLSAEAAADVRGKVSRIHDNPDYQKEIVDIVKNNGGMEYATAKLNDFVDKALISLRVFPDSRDKDCLKELAVYTAIRTK